LILNFNNNGIIILIWRGLTNWQPELEREEKSNGRQESEEQRKEKEKAGKE
jgi:hypothetical protein